MLYSFCGARVWGAGKQVESMSEQQSGRERRQFGRREANVNASARLSTGSIAACIIREISEGGALLEFPVSFGQPSRLRLTWEGNHEVLCEVRHVRDRMIGVQFVQTSVVSVERPMTKPIDEATRLPEMAANDVSPSRASAELVARKRNEWFWTAPPAQKLR